jgi:hypothetical protein
MHVGKMESFPCVPVQDAFGGTQGWGLAAVLSCSTEKDYSKGTDSSVQATGTCVVCSQ